MSDMHYPPLPDAPVLDLEYLDRLTTTLERARSKLAEVEAQNAKALALCKESIRYGRPGTIPLVSAEVICRILGGELDGG